MKTTLDLPDEIVREVKLRAVVQGRTVKDLVAEYLRQSLGLPPLGGIKKPVASPMVEIGAHGLPVFRCSPDAPATRMSVVELLKLEQDSQMAEDMQRAGIAL